jgi:hypothetical protein
MGQGSERHDELVVWIGVFKLTKTAALTAAGLAGLLARPEHLAARAGGAVAWLGGLPGRDTLQRTVGKLWSLDNKSGKLLALGALAYAAVFAVEGVGLVLRKRWAEWLTVVVTGSFIPLEIYEMIAHFGAGKVVALVLNVAIVGYLIVARLRERRS